MFTNSIIFIDIHTISDQVITVFFCAICICFLVTVGISHLVHDHKNAIDCPYLFHFFKPNNLCANVSLSKLLLTCIIFISVYHCCSSNLCFGVSCFCGCQLSNLCIYIHCFFALLTSQVIFIFVFIISLYCCQPIDPCL